MTTALLVALVAVMALFAIGVSGVSVYLLRRRGRPAGADVRPLDATSRQP